MTITVELAYWVAITFSVLVPSGDSINPGETEDTAAHRGFPISEDHPDWDCSTMGNRICGPENGLPATIDGRPMLTAADVVECAERIGGATDSNLARCADLANFECGNLYVDPYREDCR